MIAQIVTLLMLFLAACSNAQAPVAYLLCVNHEPYTRQIIYYLEPLASNVRAPPVIDFNPQSITLLHATSMKGADAEFVETTRSKSPLLIVDRVSTTEVMTVDLNRFTTNVVSNGLSANDGYAYVDATNQYWRVSVVNNEGRGQNIVVMYLYSDLDAASRPTYSSNWISATHAFTSPRMAADSRNNLLYLSLEAWQLSANGGAASGVLMTYNMASNAVIHDVKCESRLAIRYSPSRGVLYGATLAANRAGDSYPTSIVELDPASCRIRSVIEQLPEVNAGEMNEAFNEETGDWYFTWAQPSTSNTGSQFYVVNVDSKSVTNAVGLTYDKARTDLLGIVMNH